MFEVEFTSMKLNEKERKDLVDSITSITPGMITFRMEVDSSEVMPGFTRPQIVPLNAIHSLCNVALDRNKNVKDIPENFSDLHVNILSPSGEIMSSVIYKRCAFFANFNDFLTVDASDPRPKSITVEFKYESVMLNTQQITV